ncbi:hypothetical protein OK349_12860 [Sphingomonas sp. BT-65]|uniref:hypothetical protein n=1 Tax=Sphingomonas sp. BT-65 TaxID=2989821 RepID=UPI00223616A0|nr:hypothetical protein [Sphingomonas sp. BT-65]MCW4462601.1 hypothetical protein [Sphingomonas sp. BT-65]
MKQLALVLLSILLAPPAIAQDGAMGDMTIVGSAIAQGQIAEIEARKRSPGQTSRRTSEASSATRARANCARKAAFRARYGASDPRVLQLYRLCARAGY